MEQSRLKIGIIGGTFDPIHIGHLIIAEDARFRLKLDKVLFVPAGYPPHKPGKPISDARHRLAMVEAAITGNPSFEIFRFEIDNQKTSYTVYTLEALLGIYKDAELFFIMGTDSLAEITTWHDPDRLVRMCRIAAAERIGFDREKVLGMLPEDYHESIVFLDAPIVEISSTEIRRRVVLGESIRYLVPKGVEDYIVRNAIYGSGE
jgi:nicotinate-nucleotide adenylyltransferase